MDHPAIEIPPSVELGFEAPQVEIHGKIEATKN